MKYVLLGDTHLGARNGSSRFSKHFNKFFTDVLYPYIIDNDIDTIIQLGDLFDNRTNLSYKAFHACKEQWFTPLESIGIDMHVLLGNHDIYHKNTLEINSPELLLSQYENIYVHKTPVVIKELGEPIFDLVPWICAENADEVLAAIGRKERAKYCAGHFEVAGFSMYRGGETLSHGLSPSLITKGVLCTYMFSY
jgi:DNA repair exonuclease SbcCD nuclease subunit